MLHYYHHHYLSLREPLSSLHYHHSVYVTVTLSSGRMSRPEVGHHFAETQKRVDKWKKCSGANRLTHRSSHCFNIARKVISQIWGNPIPCFALLEWTNNLDNCPYYIHVYICIYNILYLSIYLSIHPSIHPSIRAYLDPLGPSSDLSQWLILAQHLHGVDLSRRFLRHLKDLSETATAQPWFSTNSMDSRQQQLTIGEPSVGSVFLKKNARIVRFFQVLW